MKEFLKKIIPKSFYKLIKDTRNYFFSLIMYVVRIFPIDNKKIVISSFNGRGYGDNPKYVCEALDYKNKKLIWLVKEYDHSIPNHILQIKYESIKALYHLGTAKVWIDNSRKEIYVRKRKKQIYIQMWHGSIALKKIEKDAIDILSDKYVKRAINDSKMIDLMISNSNFSDKLFSKSFWYSGEILKSGSPRIDSFFNNKDEIIKEKFCERYKINKEYSFIIYAPTFRDSLSLECYKFDQEQLIKTFEKKYKKKFCLLLKLHPNLKGALKFENSNALNIIDVCDYPDIYELMKISDYLITDYSSLMFEFPINGNKPVFIFASDLEKYNREFYFDLNQLPFSLATNSNELIHNIKEFDEKSYYNRIECFYEQLELFEDGRASQRIVDYIEKSLKS